MWLAPILDPLPPPPPLHQAGVRFFKFDGVGAGLGAGGGGSFPGDLDRHPHLIIASIELIN